MAVAAASVSGGRRDPKIGVAPSLDVPVKGTKTTKTGRASPHPETLTTSAVRQRPKPWPRIALFNLRGSLLFGRSSVGMPICPAALSSLHALATTSGRWCGACDSVWPWPWLAGADWLLWKRGKVRLVIRRNSDAPDASPVALSRPAAAPSFCRVAPPPFAF